MIYPIDGIDGAIAAWNKTRDSNAAQIRNNNNYNKLLYIIDTQARNIARSIVKQELDKFKQEFIKNEIDKLKQELRQELQSGGISLE